MTQHIRIFVQLFGSFRYCLWGGDVSPEEAGVIAAAVAGLSTHGIPLSVQSA